MMAHRLVELRPWLLGLPIGPARRRNWLIRFGATVGSNVRVHPIRVMNANWHNLTIADD